MSPNTHRGFVDYTFDIIGTMNFGVESGTEIQFVAIKVLFTRSEEYRGTPHFFIDANLMVYPNVHD